MPAYAAPLREYRFVLHELLGVAGRQDVPGFEEVDEAVVDAALEGAARVAEEVWAPLNQSGDAEGCVYENGVVRAPSGFAEAMAAWYAGGWNAVGVDSRWGGHGLPGALASCVSEMAMSANLSLSTYVGLSMGVAGTLMRIAPDAVRQLYVPRLLSGQWTGTMNLTEPHCGTDLKLMRTRAEEQADGSYRVTGTKIFITGGEHDMAENIAHLVLAKVPEEGEGLTAVSLFLVPKYKVNDDGSLSPANGVSCGGIEHKMGIRGSATAVLHYDGAEAIRLGAKPKPATNGDGKDGKRSSSRGMAGMFTLMNAARIGVGLQGVALAEVAYQNAVTYANERLAGRALSGAQFPEQPADPIIVHPDVRRMLLHIRSFVEAARALSLWLMFRQQLAQRSGDADEQQASQDLMNLLTPLIKAHFSDLGFDCANMAMQCFGGHGYVRDHGMEQFVRDARISQLYEGANGVQALDLVGRRLPADNGRPVQTLFATINALLEEEAGKDELADFTGPLKTGLERLMQATMWLAQNAPQDREQAGGGASDYLRLMGTVVLGFMWTRMARQALTGLEANPGERDFYEMKLATGRYYMARVMPDTAALLDRVTAGAGTLMAPEAAWF